MSITILTQCSRKRPSNTISLQLCPVLRVPLRYRPLSSHRSAPSKETKRLRKAPRVLDFINPKANAIDCRRSHLRLIQEFLETNKTQLSDQCVHDDSVCAISVKDSVYMLFQMHKKGLRADPSVLSQALSSCGCGRVLGVGIQVHCMAVSSGFATNVYVGSSLISFYGKCCALDSACKLFEDMPVKNVVLWTAILSGFALEWKIGVCLELYQRMRNSTVKPNDITFTSLLGACSGSGTLGQGKSAHCQIVRLGFDSYVHVANALISMYCKCGNIWGAWSIFENMPSKDIVSWNSMIAGCAEHGLAWRAIELFEEMKVLKLNPDAITFLGVLSSCRHAGLVDKGQLYFSSMDEFGVKPELDHYSCIVDLLGRGGFLEEALNFIKKMPLSPNAIIWGSLLSSCRLHRNVWIGVAAAESRLMLEPDCAATHLQLANLYASVGYWDRASEVWKLMKDKGLKADTGCSWIQIGNGFYQFGAEGCSNAQANEIMAAVDGLVDHMKSLGCDPEMHE